ncbi:MAG TPA: 23S rRNA (adenine(2030)-N(6))-methyltransferase RlmJ [Hyphomicrobiales bacterium]|nr:23S rRNA (adenine(2030)-N(6))-methyltransferase RlmJ [Hyphomicrobiales bacterium]
MNYRHAFHAGNFADVLKHAIMAQVLVYLGLKEAPFRYLDSHAGRAVYRLDGPEAGRSGEWQSGIGRLRGKTLAEPLAGFLAPYLDMVISLEREAGAGAYPGSPEIARRLARPQDRLLLCERHPEEAEALRAAMHRDRRVKVVEIDGWQALGAWLPPPERRGAVLIDPPYEEPGEAARLLSALAAAHRKWPTGTYLLWYPVKDPLAADALRKAAGRAGIPRILAAELLIRRPADPSRLNGSGVLIVNPPWTLANRLAAGLPALARELGEDEHARGRVQQVAGEHNGKNAHE